MEHSLLHQYRRSENSVNRKIHLVNELVKLVEVSITLTKRVVKKVEFV